MGSRVEHESTGWYAVTLLFVSRVRGVPSLRPMCEERVVALQSDTREGVTRRVREYAKEEEHSYQNTYGEKVTWGYAGILRIEPIEEPTAGQVWEVASRYVRRGRSALRKLTRAASTHA